MEELLIAKILLLHLIKQAAAGHTTRSRDKIPL